MVLVEELTEEVEEATEPSTEPMAKEPKEPKSETLEKGFLDKAKEKPLYGPEGSPEGVVSPDTHKAHAEHKMNDDLNKGMNRGATDNNGVERPDWYTKEWPKDCQYNSPGCTLHEMDTSGHASAIHKDMVRGGIRWAEATAPGAATIRLTFMGLTDEDLAEVVQLLKGNDVVKELDLSHNHIKDTGVQNLVAALAGGAAPNLRELRLYSNEFGELGKMMLTQGLTVFRKKLEIVWEEPSWARLAKAKTVEASGGTAMAPAAA